MGARVSKNDSGLPTEAFPSALGPATTLAAAGSAIGNAAAIASRFTVVTGADNAKGVILPSTASPGDEYVIYSSVASNGLLVYPHSTGDINDGSGNASVAMEGKSVGRFIMLDGTTWVGMFTANT